MSNWKLFNGLVGVVMDFKVIDNKVKISFVKFEDEARNAE